MHKFIDELKTADKWVEPTYPAADDPDWEKVFDAATPHQKTQIANGWLWLLNKAKPKSDTMSAPEHFYWLIRYRNMYGKVGAYATDIPDQYVLDGGFMKLLAAARIVRTPQVDAVISAVQALLSENPQNIKQHILAIGNNLLINIDAPGRDDTSHLVALVQHVVWDKLKDKRIKNDPECTEVALRVSMMYGIFSGSARPLIDGYGNTVSRSWQAIGRYSLGKDRIDNRKRVTERLQAALADVPQTTALRMLAIIFKYKMERQRDPNIHPNINFNDATIWNIERKGMWGPYQVLKQWMPQLTAHWASAEVLGLSSLEAIEYAAKLTTENALEHVATDLHLADMAAGLDS